MGDGLMFDAWHAWYGALMHDYWERQRAAERKLAAEKLLRECGYTAEVSDAS